MNDTFPPTAQEVMNQRFHHDSLISLATAQGDTPSVRTVNGFYEDGAFYVITHALSGKMQQIARNPKVAVCGEWFTAHGRGENLGHILDAKNAEMANKLRTAFAAWYDNGHTDEKDPNTCILCVHLTDGVLMANGQRFEIDFTQG